MKLKDDKNFEAWKEKSWQPFLDSQADHSQGQRDVSLACLSLVIYSCICVTVCLTRCFCLPGPLNRRLGGDRKSLGGHRTGGSAAGLLAYGDLQRQLRD